MKVASCCLVALLIFSQAAVAAPVEYTAPTGQTATADFSFPSASQLAIQLCETTAPAASGITDSNAILTSLGFVLPGGAQLTTSGTVTISAGSQSHNFDAGSFGAGSDVSGEWGVTFGQKPIGDGNVWDFVGVMEAQTNRLPGADLDGPNSGGLDGPQAGLLLDSAAVSGNLGFVSSCVDILITLSRSLTAAEQAAFLEDVKTNSTVEYGSDFAFGVPDGNGGGGGGIIPVPPTFVLMGIGGMMSCAGMAFRRRQKAAK